MNLKMKKQHLSQKNFHPGLFICLTCSFKLSDCAVTHVASPKLQSTFSDKTFARFNPRNTSNRMDCFFLALPDSHTKRILNMNIQINSIVAHFTLPINLASLPQRETNNNPQQKLTEPDFLLLFWSCYQFNYNPNNNPKKGLEDVGLVFFCWFGVSFLSGVTTPTENSSRVPHLPRPANDVHRSIVVHAPLCVAKVTPLVLPCTVACHYHRPDFSGQQRDVAR